MTRNNLPDFRWSVPLSVVLFHLFLIESPAAEISAIAKHPKVLKLSHDGIIFICDGTNPGDYGAAVDIAKKLDQPIKFFTKATGGGLWVVYKGKYKYFGSRHLMSDMGEDRIVRLLEEWIESI